MMRKNPDGLPPEPFHDGAQRADPWLPRGSYFPPDPFPPFPPLGGNRCFVSDASAYPVRNIFLGIDAVLDPPRLEEKDPLR